MNKQRIKEVMRKKLDKINVGEIRNEEVSKLTVKEMANHSNGISFSNIHTNGTK